MNKYLFIAIILIIAACSDVKKNYDVVIQNDTLDLKKENKVLGLITDSTDRITVIFPEFKIEVFGAKIFEKQQSPEFPIKSDNDTVQVWLEFNNSIEDKHFRISRVGDISVYQKYRTSLIIKNQNSFLGFYDWKHYNSEWEKISNVRGSIFKSIKYSKSQSSLFPEISKEKLLKAIKYLGDSEWYNLAKDVKTVNDYPCEVIIDRVYLKVELKEKTRVIVFINQLKI